MPKYTQGSKERVRDAIDMADLVGSKVELRRAGANRMVGLCPFHDERSPSFGIDPVQKVYHCFGCGEGGDAFRFVMETEGLDFKGALESLADRYNVTLEVEDEDPRDAEKRRRRERLMELLERTAAFYVRLLWEAPEAEKARAYLQDRGLDEQTLRAFRVGWAPDSYDRVITGSRKAGYGDAELRAAGLSRERNNRRMDFFHKQVMFPLTDTRGRVLGFAGRTLDPDDRRPKYINSPDSDLFHKRYWLFGADLARASAAKAGGVVLAEGYTDVIALHQAGLRNAVATMGTALTEDQVTTLARLAPVVHLALDADAAGQSAMVRAAQVARGKKLELRVVQLPKGEDPADLLRRVGPEEVEELVKASIPFVRFRVKRELEIGDLSTAEGKDRILGILKPVLAPLGPSVERQELLHLIADRMDVSEELVTQLLQAARTPAPIEDDIPPPDDIDYGDPEDEPAPPPPPRQLDRRERSERAFLALCIALPDAGAKELAELDLEADFQSPVSRRLATHLSAHMTDPSAGIDAGDTELAMLVNELAVRAARIEPAPTEVRIERLQLQLARVDRDITAARRAGEGGISELAGQRTTLQAELHAAMASQTDR